MFNKSQPVLTVNLMALKRKFEKCLNFRSHNCSLDRI